MSRRRRFHPRRSAVEIEHSAAGAKTLHLDKLSGVLASIDSFSSPSTPSLDRDLELQQWRAVWSEP